jgi:hypothetical protein
VSFTSAFLFIGMQNRGACRRCPYPLHIPGLVWFNICRDDMNHAVNWEAISAIGQIVGALAVVISLIYVASEVRRNTSATQLAAMRSMRDAFNQWIQQLAQYPDLTEIYNRGIHDFESLERTDSARFSILMHGAFRNFEEIYYLRAKGHLEQGVWRGWDTAMRDVNGYPEVQSWWRLRSHWFNEEFAKFIDYVQQTAKPPPPFHDAKADQ